MRGGGGTREEFKCFPRPEFKFFAPCGFSSLLRLAKIFAGIKMKRGAPDDSPPRREKTYAGAGVSPEVKDHTARFAVELQAHGVSMSIILSSLQGTEYAPAARTLREHMAAVKRNEAPLSGEKEAGRPPALTDEQWAIVFGRVLRQTKPVALEDVQRWIKANLGMDVSIATVSRQQFLTSPFPRNVILL